MTACSILVFLSTLCLAINCVLSSPIEGQASYVEGLTFKYENGKWTCGDVYCPARTAGCKIRIRSDEEDEKIIYQYFDCINAIGAADRIELTKEKSVDIDINTYVGAKSAFRLSYSLMGKEIADGVVAPDELEELKAKFKDLKANVIEKKMATGVFTRGLED